MKRRFHDNEYLLTEELFRVLTLQYIFGVITNANNVGF